MNRAERRQAGIKGSFPILEITQEQLEKHMPHVVDGDVVKIRRNGREGVYRVQVTATAKPEELAS